MASILVAASPEPAAVAERILAQHVLCRAATMVQAEQFLRERSFDLIFSTVVFDESRMLDLLRLVKSSPEWRHIPFVCARLIPYVLDAPALAGVSFTCRILGAVAFLDLADYRIEPEREFLEAIERFLRPPSAKLTAPP